MRHVLPLALPLLLLGGLALLPGRGEVNLLSGAGPALAASPPETGVELLAAPTGPVGAVAVDPRDPKTIYLGGTEGLFRSQDSGTTWSLLSRDLRYPHILLVDPLDPARLYAARRDLASFLPLPGLYRSTDGGSTWKWLGSGVLEERIFALALDPGRRDTLYAGTWAGRLYKSIDGGERWTLCPSAPLRPCPQCSPGTVSQLLVHPVDGALYAVEAYVGTFRSADGGVSWQQISAESGWLAVDTRRGDLYLAGRRLQRSTDGGRTWVDLSAGLPFNPRTGAYVTSWVAVNPQPWTVYTRYHRSGDGGATWEPLETPPAFLPRLLVPGSEPVLYGSLSGLAGRYRDPRVGAP